MQRELEGSGTEELFDDWSSRMAGAPNTGSSLLDLLSIGLLFVLAALLLVVLGVVESLDHVLGAALLVAAAFGLVRVYNLFRLTGH